MILELTPKEGEASQEGQVLSGLETSFENLAVSETREKDVADLEYSISKITLEGDEDDKDSQEEESSELEKEEYREIEKDSDSPEPSSYGVPSEVKVEAEEEAEKNDEDDEVTDKDAQVDSSEEEEKENAVSEHHALVEEASDTDKDEKRSSSEIETTKDGSDAKESEDDEEEKCKEQPKEAKSGEKVTKESKGKQLLPRGLGSGLGNKQYMQPHQDVYHGSYNWTQGPQQALTASAYGMPAIPTLLDSSTSSMSNMGSVDGFQSHFPQYSYMIDQSPSSQVDNMDAVLPQLAAQEQRQTDINDVWQENSYPDGSAVLQDNQDDPLSDLLKAIWRVEKEGDRAVNSVDDEKVRKIKDEIAKELEGHDGEYSDESGRCRPSSVDSAHTNFPMSTGMNLGYENNTVLAGMNNSFMYANSSTSSGMFTNSPAPSSVDDGSFYMNSPSSTNKDYGYQYTNSPDSGFSLSPMPFTLDNEYSDSPSPVPFVDITRDDAKKEICMHMDQVKHEKCYRKISAMTNERVASKDADGDTSQMIVACQSEDTRNFYENLYCVTMRSKDIKMCCDQPVNHNSVPKTCSVCGNTNEQKFYSPLSVYNSQNLTPLSAALRRHHDSRSPNAHLIVRFLCEVISQNPADIPRIFNQKSAPSFQPYLNSYPVLYNFINLIYEETELS